MSAPEVVTRALSEAGVPFELLPHPRTERARAEARALGMPPDDVAKTVVLRTPTGFLRAVIPASERLDLHKVRDLIGGDKRTHLASEEDLAQAYPEFELGAIPPFSGNRADPVLFDARLVERQAIVVEAGVHDASIRLAPGDLLGMAEDGRVADICDTHDVRGG